MVLMFAALILVHLLYDFHWQGPFIGNMKSKSNFLLAVHALTWAMLLCTVIYFMGALSWWQLPFLFITHLLIDYWKCHKTYEITQPEYWKYLYIDQVLHLITIIIVSI
jgi:hypothetical protein